MLDQQPVPALALRLVFLILENEPTTMISVLDDAVFPALLMHSLLVRLQF